MCEEIVCIDSKQEEEVNGPDCMIYIFPRWFFLTHESRTESFHRTTKPSDQHNQILLCALRIGLKVPSLLLFGQIGIQNPPQLNHQPIKEQTMSSMSIIDNTFPEHMTTIKIIKVSGMALAVIIQLCIGTLTYSKLRHAESQTRRELPFLFFIAVLSALVFTIGAVISNLMWVLYGSHPTISIATVTVPFFYCFFLITLLGTLVTRLYVTFKGSSLEMTQRTVQIFLIIFVFESISSILTCTGHALIVYGYDNIGDTITYPTACSFYILYIIGSALPVRLFTGNLSKIAKMQRNSNLVHLSHSGHSDTSPVAQDTSLNSKQLTLLHLSAKYILLFFVAVISTILTYVLIVIVSFECRGLFMAFDLCLNLFCMYLQFAFAKKHYQKCCGCLDSRCRMCVLNRARKAIHKEAVKNQAALVEMSSVSPESTVNSVQNDESGTIEI